MSVDKEIASDLKWYVVRAATGYEKHVTQFLQEAIVQHEMQAAFGRILVPTEEVIEMRAGQKRKSQRKFFPGYVLVEMVMNDDTWHLVRHVSKVLGFVGGTQEKPASITEAEAQAILHQLQSGGDRPKHKVLFEPGEMVRVIDGPFADFDAVVEDVNYEKSRLRVAVLIFGRSTPVDLEFSQVEKT